MVIVCPSCASEYTIDAAKVGAEGRTVRCAKCRETWFVKAEAPASPVGVAIDASRQDSAAADAGTTTQADASAETTRNPAETARPGRFRRTAKGASSGKSGRLRAGLGTSSYKTLGAAACVILAITALSARRAIVEALPETANLYAAIGLPVNLRGLEFRGITSELASAGADTFLVVEGEIANVTGRERPVPPIEIRVRGADGQMLYTWTHDPPQNEIAASETTRFRARLAAPPAEAKEVLVHFAPSAGGQAVAGRAR